jgi:hypothetical protein
MGAGLLVGAWLDSVPIEGVGRNDTAHPEMARAVVKAVFGFALKLARREKEEASDERADVALVPLDERGERLGVRGPA